MPSKYRLRGKPFRFSGKYYDDYLRELIRYLSINAPELTSRDPSDPVIQEQRAIANALHHTSVISDHIALESMPYTSRLVESLRQHLKLIDYDLRLETPSTVEILGTLSREFETDSNQIVTMRALAESDPVDDDTNSVYFEYMGSEDLVIGRTDEVSRAFVYQQAGDIYNTGVVSGVNHFTKSDGPDFTPEDVNRSLLVIYNREHNTFGTYSIEEYIDENEVILGNDYLFEDMGTTDPLKWYLLRISDDLDVNDNSTSNDLWNFSDSNNMLYFGHEDVMFDSARIKIPVGSLGNGFFGTWEYTEKNKRLVPPSRVNECGSGVGIEFELETLYSDTNNSGARVYVEHIPTGTHMECVSYYDNGVNKIHTIGLLGQDNISYANKDYVVGSEWLPLPDLNDRTENFNIGGKVSYRLPQSLTHNWKKTVVDDTKGYWLRYRIIGSNTAHIVADETNEIPDVATDFDSALDLYNDLVANFNNHISNENRYHLFSDDDEMNISTAGDWAELSDDVNEAKDLFNSHIENDQHWSFVDDTVILDPSVANQTSVLGVLNTMVANFNTHINSHTIVPRIEEIDITNDNQYIMFDMVQGRYVMDNPLGSSNGLPSQVFQLKRDEFIEGTDIIEVNEDNNWIRWTRVDSFINSTENDRHYTVITDGDHRTFIRFGGVPYEDNSGKYGRIPPTGVGNIRARYRNGAKENGNVGSNTVINATSGMVNISNITNPRPAFGWVKREGDRLRDFDIVMDKASQGIKSMGKCVTATDAEQLAIQWVDEDGSSPIGRAFSLEEAFGHKTIGLWVVSNSGTTITNGQLDRINDYFNGENGVALANTQVIVSNFSRRNIQLDIFIIGDVSRSRVKQALIELIRPLKMNRDNTDYLWKPGGRVFSSRIIDEIHSISDNIRSVEVVSGGNVQLGEEELPLLDIDNLSINIVP